MARALAHGWGDAVLCADSGSGRAAELAAELSGRATSSLEVARGCDVVVLCHKPYQLGEVAAQIAGAARAVVSVLGATSIADLQGAYPGVPIFRIEPNTPVEVRRGVLLYCAAADVPAEFERKVVALFSRLGWVTEVPESKFGAAAAVSSVGPAYLALVAEAQVDAAVRHGLTPALAGRLAAETLAGTAELLGAREYDTLAVRRGVTSPGGVTARGLDALERGGLRSAFADAMDAVDRS